MIKKEVDVLCPKCKRISKVTLEVQKEASYMGETKYIDPIGHKCPVCGMFWDKIEVMESKDGEIEANVLLEE